ncbi:MAG: hypothetical protein Ta2E_09910 [Mycoplasmoidaceae bacterium]|nr:MAG: hypothetical protein Ta2E_09910 [Mycoplasmoidaceae bacterium]
MNDIPVINQELIGLEKSVVDEHYGKIRDKNENYSLISKEEIYIQNDGEFAINEEVVETEELC